MTAPQQKVFSVSEFVGAVSAYLEQGLGMVAVQGEVSGFNVNRDRLVFFDLKDKKSRVKCFMMTHELGVPLEDGMEVKVIGTAKLFQASGMFHVRVMRVELVGAGALQRAYALLKAKLEAEGLFAPERKRALPQFPEHIAVVTSKDAAAWTDVKRVLKNRWPLAQVTLTHVGVQGQGAIGEIVGAIRWWNEKSGGRGAGFKTRRTDLRIRPDVIILTRGGGSLEDLQAFNSEHVARAIFSSGIPIICGVGHERDVTLADFVADVRAATPSNAAELATPDAREVMRQVASNAAQVTRSFAHRLVTERHTLHERLAIMHDALRNAIAAPAAIIERFFREFERFRGTIRRSHDAVIAHHARLMTALAHRCTMARDALTAQERLLKTLSPHATLARGYTITMVGGAVVKSAAALHDGDTLTTRFADGETKSRVI